MRNALEFDTLEKSFALQFGEAVELVEHPIPDGDGITYPTAEEKEVKTNSRYYSEIARAIQEKRKTNVPFLPCDMPAGVVGVYAEGEKVGYNAGHSSGYEEGKADGNAEGYEAGRQAEYDAFWDSFQDYGNRTAYSSAFGAGWNAEIFKPKYLIKPTGHHGQYLFHFFNYGNPLLDFRTIKDKCDISATTSASYMFSNAWVDYIELDFSNITQVQNCFDESFSPGHKTHITLKMSNKTTVGLTTAFYYCNALTHLFFESGSEITVSINLQYSPLIKESITSVINALSSSVTGQTATFKKTAKEKAFTADEWSALISTKSNWTISLV